MGRFFIDRPVFAIVISLFLVLAGGLTALQLPVAQYPQIALPTVRVSATYPGASADVVEEAVTTPLDLQINGVTDMLYVNSTSGNDGSSSITVTFALERDPDLAAVEVQNRVSAASSALPPEVLSLGVTTAKQSPDTLMFLAFSSPNGTYDRLFLTNYVNLYVADTLKRVAGIGNVQVFGSEFGMRVWLKPDIMARLGLTTTDVMAAVREQNVQAPAGQVGQPPVPDGQSFQYSVRVRGRLVEEHEFENIVLRAEPNGSFIRMRDIARVELGARTYDFAASYQGRDATVAALYLSPGANALDTGTRVRAELERLRRQFPSDLTYNVVVDTNEFVNASIEGVVTTFIEAMVLVLLVVFLFLQTWRATVIPMLAVPVSLIATFIAYSALGFSINTLSLFGMILAIGIVVDDAIIVVEAAEHIMDTKGLDARAATREAMDQVSGPVVAIALVLAAVFVPMAFIPGITGQLYKQFALTVAISVLFSAVVALTLTPALCATMLQHRKTADGHARRGPVRRFFGAFNRWFERLVERYGNGVARTVRRWPAMIVALLLVSVGCLWLFRIVPTGFVPEEDQGFMLAQVTLPEAASQQRTIEVTDQVTARLRGMPAVESTISVVGFDIISGTAASNASFIATRLRPWAERTSSDLHVAAVMRTFSRNVANIPEAIIQPFNPPPLPGLGATGGFSMMLESLSAASPQELMATSQALLTAVRQRPEIGTAYTTFSAVTPGYRLDVDREKAKRVGVPVSDVFNTLQVFLGGVPVNDFTRFGRNFKVTLQAEADYRESIDAMRLLFVRSAQGQMVPLDTLVQPASITSARYLQRYNLYRAAQINGSAAPGYSSGQAIEAVEDVARSTLSPEYGFEWTGLSRQELEAGNSGAAVIALSLVVVFLFLAALYESWSVPFAVLLAVPFGVLGALATILMRALDFDVYGQIGMVTLIGLSAKNAILIVEYAKANHEAGMPLADAAVAASKVRLRPIIMTSLAFILGIVPLAIASGAGAASKISVGTAVFGGMTVATVTAIFSVPTLYVIVQGLAERIRGVRVGAPPELGPARGEP
jgi:hydrophobe/amphiphile efflux-1 (HAE1) family protein